MKRPTAAKELLRRRLIRRNLTEWGRYKGYEPAPHHRLICREIDAFLSSDDEVLLLFAPPGSAKSTWLSVLFPSHYLARFPKNSILAATHSVEFAQRWGRRVRNDIALDSAVLGIDSETVRKKRWDWYIDDFSARLKPNAKRILMNTRWHAEDVAGRVLDQIDRGIVRGRVISIPAIADGNNDALGRKPGEYLWDEPDGYNYGAFLRARQREASPMMWSALYQQRPAPEEGDYFKAAWLKSYVTAPALETLAVYGASDYAVTADGGDWTVHVVVGVDPDGHMYLLDMWRKQASSDVWIEAFCSLVKDWKPREWAEEQGQIKAGVGPFIERMQRERQAYVYRRAFPTRGDKAVRAQSIRGRMALDGLYVPEHAGWYADFRLELLNFPAGKHDDIVDALGLVGQLLDYMAVGKKPDPEPEKLKDTGYRRYEFEPDNSWLTY